MDTFGKLDDSNARVLDYSEYFARLYEREREALEKAGARRINLFDVMAITARWQDSGYEVQQSFVDGGVLLVAKDHPEEGELWYAIW